jgi:beta-phosphoglucomutase-like phosphatase (HAD superfamily)
VRPLELDVVTEQWQRALDAAERALRAAGDSLPASDLGPRRYELGQERLQTARLLERLADVAGVKPAPWLSPVPVNHKLLGLPFAARACLFDVEGVLTDSDVLHAWAWGQVFDEFLLRQADKTGRHFVPFDRVTDYRAHVDGRSRLEGIHAFLGSRGIHLLEGTFDDPAEADTAFGLAKRKGEVLASGLRQRGVSALPGARRYLEAAGRAGLERAVVSASSTTLPMLDLAEVATLVDERVDADAVLAEGLRPRPAPDVLLDACDRLSVPPEAAVTFTHTPAGVVAGPAAGLDVIVVAEGAEGELLRSSGERVVPSLSALLDPRLRPESRDERP